jgi:hypothetical protein
MMPEVAALVCGLLVRGRHSFKCVPHSPLLSPGDKLVKITGVFETRYVLERAYDKALEYFDQNKFRITDPLY